MEILFLGTGAADWTPAFKNQKQYRSNSAIFLDYNLLIDAGAQLFDFEKDFYRNSLFAKTKLLLITHSHKDHFSAENINKLAEICGDNFTVAGDAQVMKIFNDTKIKTVSLSAYESYEFGEYRVTPLLANHSTEICGENPLHYVIEKNGKKLYYGTDGAWITKSAWLWLYKNKGFNAMIFDATIGFDHKGDYRIFEHNSLEMLLIMLETIRVQGVCANNCKFIATHLARTLHPDQKTLEESLERHGITAAYDNLKILI